MWIVKIVLLLLVAVLGAALALLNPDPVSFDFYYGDLQMSLALVLVMALAAGILFGVLVGLFWSLGVRRENAQLRRRLELSEQELKVLRTLPVKGH